MDFEALLASAPFASSAQAVSNARIIAREFHNAGYSTGLALAAIANAWAESSLSNHAVGDSGHSVGLFQINDLQGKRNVKGIPDSIYGVDRRDPTQNTRWILAEMKRNWDRQSVSGSESSYVGESLGQIYNRGGSIAELTGAFTAFIERPSDPAGHRRTRMAWIQSWLGSLAGSSGRSFLLEGVGTGMALLDPKGTVLTIPTPFWWAGIVLFSVVGLAGYRRATQK